MPSDVDVVVIGGGAAGVAASKRLAQAALRCLLVEARPRLGGRAWTVHDTAGHALDLGCGWLHSADRNPWVGVAQAEGLSLDEAPPPWMSRPLARSFPSAEHADFRKAFSDFYERLDEAAQREGDAPASSLLDPSSRWNALLNATSTYISGAELDRISLKDLDRYHPTDVNWRVIEGYGTTHQQAWRGPAANAGLSGQRHRSLWQTAAHRHRQRRDHRRSGHRDGAERSARGRTDRLYAGAAGQDRGRARPAFGRRRQAFRCARRRGRIRCRRSRVRAYRSRGDRGLSFAAVRLAHYRVLFRRLLRRGAGTRRRGRVFRFCRGRALRRVRQRFRPPTSSRSGCIGWHSDPFALGAYSYASPGNADCRAALAKPVDDRLFFAGEACSPHDFSTAHGGYLTGVAAAERVIASRNTFR